MSALVVPPVHELSSLEKTYAQVAGGGKQVKKNVDYIQLNHEYP